MSQGDNGQSKTPTSLIQPKKGFRQTPAPTKADVMEENLTLAKNLENRMNQLTQGIGNALIQYSGKLGAMQSEVDAMTTLAASDVLGPDGIVQAGDHVMMDYLGALLNEDGTPEMDEYGLPKYFDGGFGTTFVLQNVGSGKLIPGFEDQLLGKKSGETFEISVQFPEGYGAKEMANRKAKFLVHIHRIYRTVEESLVLKTKRAYELQKAKLRAESEAARKAENAQPTETTQESPAEAQEGTANEQNNV